MDQCHDLFPLHHEKKNFGKHYWKNEEQKDGRAPRGRTELDTVRHKIMADIPVIATNDQEIITTDVPPEIAMIIGPPAATARLCLSPTVKKAVDTARTPETDLHNGKMTVRKIEIVDHHLRTGLVTARHAEKEFHHRTMELRKHMVVEERGMICLARLNRQLPLLLGGTVVGTDGRVANSSSREVVLAGPWT